MHVYIIVHRYTSNVYTHAVPGGVSNSVIISVIVIVVVAALALLAIVCCVCIRKSKQNKLEMPITSTIR